MSQLMEKPGADSDVPEGISVMHILDNTGDTRILWDPRNPDEVKIARDAFAAAKKKKMTGYSVKEDGKKGEVMQDFDPKAGKIIMAPQLVGG